MVLMDQCGALFLAFSRRKLVDELWPRLDKVLQSVTDDQLWWRPNEASNSIGNLLLHLNGNMRQWVLAGVGGIEYNRDRDAEFAQRENIESTILRGIIGETIAQIGDLLPTLTLEQLLPVRQIQDSQVTGLEAIHQVVTHFAMHYGQILYIIKMLESRDLGFYAYLNKAAR
jgi:uncharacterized damage-inducible protein DinB